MKKVLALMLMLALILTFAAAPMSSMAAQTGAEMDGQVDDPLARYVDTGNSGKLNVRSTPKTRTDNLIAQLENGTRVVILAFYEGNSWVMVEFPQNGKTATGFVQNRYLSTEKPADVKPTAKPAATPAATTAPTLDFKNFKHVEPKLMTVKPSTPGGFVNLRWGPSKSVSVMDKLYADAQVIMIAKDNTWAQVYDPASGYVGFMMLSFLK